MFSFMDDLFVPSRKHAEDERNRLELTREDEGSSDPARGPIDLDSGAVLVRPPRTPADQPEADPEGEGAAGPEGGPGSETGGPAGQPARDGG